MFFGNSLIVNECIFILETLLENFPNVQIIFIAPALNESSRLKVDNLNLKYLNRITCKYFVENIYESFADCDLAIGAPGNTTWERAIVGIPSAYITFNKAQYEIISKMAEDGFCFHIASFEDLNAEILFKKLSAFFSNTDNLSNYSKKSLNLIDGNGHDRTYNRIKEIFTC